MAILHGLDRTELMSFGVGIRSRFLDELVLELVAAAHMETVLSLGAGLDTRPWRLGLPAALRWVEADFSDMLAYKAAALAHDAPRCALEQVPADLSDPSARAALFGRAAGRRTLLITEGLLMYLSEQTIASMAAEAALAGVNHWLMELASPELAKRVGISSCQSIESVRAAGNIDGVQTIEVLRRNGWTSARHRNYQGDIWAAAPHRVTALMQARAAAGHPTTAPPADDISGVHLFQRQT
jgi:methyltransferase (TIGR00027 family)